MGSNRTIKVGIYGAGGHARNNHLLNLTRLEDVEVVAVCDIVEQNARQAAADFGISSIYTDGHEMVKNELLDALWSTVIATAREDGVEVAAAEKGIHLFIEKPQAMNMGVAYRIDDAIRRSSVYLAPSAFVSATVLSSKKPNAYFKIRKLSTFDSR